MIAYIYDKPYLRKNEKSIYIGYVTVKTTETDALYLVMKNIETEESIDSKLFKFNVNLSDNYFAEFDDHMASIYNYISNNLNYVNLELRGCNGNQCYPLNFEKSISNSNNSQELINLLEGKSIPLDSSHFGFFSNNYKPDYDIDFIIVLGCGLLKDGTPTPLLKARVDTALDFYHRQLENTGKKLKFITSGGQGSDEVISESESMKRYLMSKGINEEDIIKEDKSTSTYENMVYSKKIIDELDGKKILYSTNNFHVFRSGLMAHRTKMRAYGIGSKTKWYFWPNAAVREFVGLLSTHKVKQLIVLTIMIVVYVVLTIFMFKVRL